VREFATRPPHLSCARCPLGEWLTTNSSRNSPATTRVIESGGEPTGARESSHGAGLGVDPMTYSSPSDGPNQCAHPATSRSPVPVAKIFMRALTPCSAAPGRGGGLKRTTSPASAATHSYARTYTTVSSAGLAKASAFERWPSKGPTFVRRSPRRKTSCRPCSGSQSHSHSSET
jgi:hypothetical protein